jgi:hypothetical protein
VLLNLSTGLGNFVKNGIMSPEAANLAARKAWEQFVGVPYTADLDGPKANPDDLAQHIEDNTNGGIPASEAHSVSGAAAASSCTTTGPAAPAWRSGPKPQSRGRPSTATW